MNQYKLQAENNDPKSIGIIMAGNIPLVGFHDFLSVFITGNKAIIKPSSKDNILIRHIAEKLNDWEPETVGLFRFEERLIACDAYIATGSNNSSRYFEYYFGKYPHCIRRNKTSVAILSGNESDGELEGLADDVFLYFGLGCRNVTKMYVPMNYDFIPLLEIFKKYQHLADHHKYKNNYDYNLALHILNKKYYMTNGIVILSEKESIFSPVSQLNYEFYSEKNPGTALKKYEDIQCIVGKGFTAFGKSQCPAIDEYADGVDTLQFLINL